MRSLSSLFVSSLVLSMSFGCGSALASDTPGSGLGSSWPNATDVSSNSHYHVYRFERGGVRYIQVNDANGTVRGAIALIGGEVLDLPIGIDASRWSIVPSNSPATSGEQVYRDDAMSMSISIAPQKDGVARMMVAHGNCDNDPLACSNHGP